MDTTFEQRTELERDILHGAFSARQEADALRLRIAIKGEHLANLANGLQTHPKQVSALPAPHTLVDNSAGIKVLRDGEKILQMCEELRTAERKALEEEKRIQLIRMSNSKD